MESWQFILIIVSVVAATAAFVWNAVKLGHHPGSQHKAAVGDKRAYSEVAKEDIEHIFNDEFREELRNRGRLHFEKIIGENAMFLQQDLRLTTSQLNEYMKQEITRTLKEEFAKYEQSITDAKQLAIASIDKTREAIEQQRQILSQQLELQVKEEKEQMIHRFEKNMSEIINHYVVSAIGEQIDLDDQLDYIISDFEANKKAIIEDINNGA